MIKLYLSFLFSLGIFTTGFSQNRWVNAEFDLRHKMKNAEYTNLKISPEGVQLENDKNPGVFETLPMRLPEGLSIPGRELIALIQFSESYTLNGFLPLELCWSADGKKWTDWEFPAIDSSAQLQEPGKAQFKLTFHNPVPAFYKVRLTLQKDCKPLYEINKWVSICSMDVNKINKLTLRFSER